MGCQSLGAWVDELENALAVFNLTGRSVDCRYTKENKSLILNSMIPQKLWEKQFDHARILPPSGLMPVRLQFIMIEGGIYLLMMNIAKEML